MVFSTLVGVSLAVGALGSMATPGADHLPPVAAWSGPSERRIVAADDPWITPAERSGFDTTPRYAEVRAWLERLDAASPWITLEVFGRSGEGRDLLCVRASKGEGKPVVLVQAGIHSGEIDGKDAGLMLLRDVAFRGKDDLLDAVDLRFVPILNVDGHERRDARHRPHQRGPREKGDRTNSRNFDLNRDYGKLDAPETRAVVALLRALDPALYIDCHVSDGFDHGYDITFTYPGWGKYARHRDTADWLEQRFGPEVSRSLREAGHHPVIYPSAVDSHDPAKGIRFSPEGPRYSTGYGDFIGVPTVLVENHELKPYRQRVLGTAVLLEAALRLAGADAARIAEAKARDRASRPAELLTRWQPAPEPIGWIDEFRCVAFETYLSPASGRPEQRWLGRPITFRMPIIGQTETERVRLPRAWWLPPNLPDVAGRLELHGIRHEVIDAPRTLALDHVRLVDPVLKRPSEGHIPVEAKFAHETREATLPAGSIRVPSDQPLGLLAAALLEPECADSFLAWGFFPEAMQPEPTTEDFVLAPMADQLLARDPGVKAEFDRKLAADPAFAADPAARLLWFRARLLPPGLHALRYPILREP